jgi:hypothetical protein
MHVPLRYVKAALCLLVNLLLEQQKVPDELSAICNTTMMIIKKSSVNQGILANCIGKIITTFVCFVVDFFAVLLLFDLYMDHNPLIHLLPGVESIFQLSRKIGFPTSLSMKCSKKIRLS